MDLEDDEEVPDDFLRFGIEFPDGHKVTNLDRPPWELSPDATEPEYGMEASSGGGSDTHYTQEWWAWPIPVSSGKLIFACEWPAYDIAESRAEIDADLVRDAAQRARPIPPDLAEGSTHVTRTSMFRESNAFRRHREGGGPGDTA